MGERVPVYLVQTDTTVGFASKDAEKLDGIKGRPAGKPYLETVATLRALKAVCRIPKSHRKRIRRAQKTTFVYPDGIARRLVREGEYADLLRRTGTMLSTSANRSGHDFEPGWAEAQCDIIIYTPAGFAQKPPSSILKIGKINVTQLR